MDTAIGDTPRPMPQFHCSTCGFGASSRIAPERCPDCSGSVWELVETRSVRDIDAPLWRDRAYTDLWRL